MFISKLAFLALSNICSDFYYKTMKIIYVDPEFYLCVIYISFILFQVIYFQDLL